jgi:hypothetical protein
LGKNFNILLSFNITRFYSFWPLTWYIIFALSLKIIYSKIKVGKYKCIRALSKSIKNKIVIKNSTYVVLVPGRDKIVYLIGSYVNVSDNGVKEFLEKIVNSIKINTKMNES